MVARRRRRTTRAARVRRHARVRRRVHGTAARPRLCVFRSSKHIYAQLIDDDAGVTLASASDLAGVEVQEDDGSGKTARAAAVGRKLAEAAKAQQIDAAVFDRGGYKYHGRVRALAEAARAVGLAF